ncbi:GAF and ANTAR domain-containing protein, partial [Mycobacterium kansasii]
EVPLEELTLSERMGEIARLLREQSGDSESLLTAATQFAVDQVPGADFACVTLVDPKGGISHPVVIGEEAQRVADVQRDLEEGPSVG